MGGLVGGKKENGLVVRYPVGYEGCDTWKAPALLSAFARDYPERWNRECATLSPSVRKPDEYRRTIVLRHLKEIACAQEQEAVSQQRQAVARQKQAQEEQAKIAGRNDLLQRAKESSDWGTIETRALVFLPDSVKRLKTKGSAYTNTLQNILVGLCEEWRSAGEAIPAHWHEPHSKHESHSEEEPSDA
jgi:hypothetical protein